MTNSMTAYVKHNGHLGLSQSGRFGWFESLRCYFERRRKIASTVFELNHCSDRELSDLGIARCDIPRIARECAQD